MSAPAFTLNLEGLIAGLSALFNSVIEGIVAALPTIGSILGAIAVVTLIFMAATRIPIVGDVINRIIGWVSGLF